MLHIYYCESRSLRMEWDWEIHEGVLKGLLEYLKRNWVKLSKVDN